MKTDNKKICPSCCKLFKSRKYCHCPNCDTLLFWDNEPFVVNSEEYSDAWFYLKRQYHRVSTLRFKWETV